MNDPGLPLPVAPLEPLLDFHPQSGTAGFEWFQRVCLDILNATPGFSDVVPVGIAGEAQQGLDIRATYREAERWGFQCKQERAFYPNDASVAIQKVPADPIYPATQYRILLSGGASDGVRRRAAQTPGWAVLDAADLSRMVRDLPLEMAAGLVRLHFGPYWVERFLGVERAATFVPPERYFRPYRNHDLLLHHDRLLRGRDEAIQRISEWHGGAGRVLIVSGRLGVGVSKLIHDFTLQAPGHIVLPLPDHIVDATALNEIPAGQVTVAVDDADDRDLAALFAFVARTPGTRLMLGSQPASEQRLRDNLIAAGIPRAELVSVPLLPIGREATILLARDTIPALNDDVTEQVVMRASDTPLATIVTAKLIAAPSAEEGVAIFDEVTARYRELIEGRLNSDISRDHVRIVVRLVAALGPVRYNSPSLAEGAVAFGLTADEAARTVAAVTDGGGFAKLGDKIEVSPSVVRDGVLVDAFSRGNAIDPSLWRLYEAYGFQKQLLHNLASANEAARATGRPAFFDDLWRRMSADVVEMDNARRLEFVEAIRSIALVKPVDVIRVLRTLHRNPPADDRQQFEEFVHITGDRVDKAMPPPIGDIVMLRPDLAKAGVELLWELAAVDPQPLHSNPSAAMRVLREAIGYDGATPSAREALVEAVADLLAREDIDERNHSPIDILEPVLDRDAHISRSRGENLLLQQFGVPLARFAVIRDRVLDLCVEAMNGARDRRAIRAIRIITKLLSGIAENAISGDDAARLLREQERVLDACDHLAAKGSTLRRVVLRDEMIKYARRTDTIGDRLDTVIASISLDDDTQLYRAVAPELARNWRILPDPTVEGLRKHEEEIALERSVVARRLLTSYPDGPSLRDAIEATSVALESAGIAPTPWHLIGQISLENVDRAIELGRAALEVQEASHVRRALAPVFAQALIDRPEAGSQLLNEARGGAEELRVAAAAALRAPLRSRDVASVEARYRFESISALLNDDSPQVRSAARLGAAFLVKELPDFAAPLIDAIHGTDGELLDWIYAEIPRDDRGQRQISDATYDRLARRLIDVDSLEWHEVVFLADGIPHQASTVLEVLEARLRKPYKRGVWAVPHDPSLDSLVNALAEHNVVEDVVAMGTRIMAESSEHDYDVHQIVGRLYGARPQETRDALIAMVATSSPKQITAIASLLRDVPPANLFDDSELFVAIVEGAYRHGVNVGKDVGVALRSSLLYRGHFRTGREHSPLFVTLQKSLRAALDRAEPASYAQAFFGELLDETNRELARELADNDEAFGRA